MQAKNFGLGIGVAVFCALAPAVMRAHEGHGAPQVVVDVLGRDGRPGETRLDLRVTNIGSQPVVLMGAGLPGQGAAALPRPLIVGPYADAVLYDLLVPVEATGGFTLILDFGPEGALPILVPAR